MKQQISWDWVGLILIILLNISVWFELDQVLRGLNWIIIVGLLCILFIRRIFDWKNIPIAFVIVFSIFPIRTVYDWQWSALIYGSATVPCVILIWRIRNHNWKHALRPILILCIGLCIWQLSEISLEMGHCYKYTEISPIPIEYSCGGTGRMYLRIKSTPIGISSPCYRCWWFIQPYST